MFRWIGLVTFDLDSISDTVKGIELWNIDTSHMIDIIDSLVVPYQYMDDYEQ